MKHLASTRLCYALVLAALIGVSVPALAGGPEAEKINRDWPFWRGPERDGTVPAQPIPLSWSETENVLWKVEIPGRGHSSPCVVGDGVYLTTADEEEQIEWALAFERETGKPRFKRELTRGGFDKPSQARRSWSNCSPASDGERIFFLSSGHDRILATALSPAGEPLWNREVGDFVSHHGYSSSPTIYRDLVLVAADHKGGGYLAGLDRKSGVIRWKTPRPEEPSYVSPTIFPIGGRDQLVISGCDLLAGYDPLSGKELWSYEAVTTECVGTVVAHGDLIFASGGYPDHLTVCAEAAPGGKVRWTKPLRTYVPSMFVHEGHLYTVTDRGIAYCWEIATGEEKWKHRLKGTFIASPTLVGDLALVSSEQGDTFIFRATPEKFDLVATNELGDQIFASPVVCDGKIFLRSTHEGAKNQEVLYCVGK